MAYPVLRGPVVRGKQLGRTLGFPTANVDCPERLPEDGVYVARIRISGLPGEYHCMVNQGHHPTAPEGMPTVEAFILDFDRDIYGCVAEITADAFLRPERRYASLDLLVRQLTFDRARTRAYYFNNGVMTEMENRYTMRRFAGPSRCDSAARQSIPDIFEQFQDIASLHAETLGLGLQTMSRRGLFWMTVRTKVLIHRRARLLEPMEIVTWPQTPGVTRCDRSYRAFSGTELIAEGRTEWCVVDMKTGRPVKPDGIFPDGFEFIEDVAAEGPYARFPHDFKSEELVHTAPVRACEIDVGRHMNNVAYTRLLTDSFSAAELAAMDIARAEIIHTMPAKEGDVLSVFRRKLNNVYLFGIKNAEGQYVALASFSERTGE